MNIDPSSIKCDEASIQRITQLVDQQIERQQGFLPRRKKSSLHTKKILLIALLTFFSLSSFAFAANVELPEFLKLAYQQLFPNVTMANKAANYIPPLDGTTIFNGIKTEMIGYIRDNDVLYLTFSLQDLEGDRLDDTTFIYDYTLQCYHSDPTSPYSENSVFGFSGGKNIWNTSPLHMRDITLVNYDDATKTATFNYRFFYNGDTSSLGDSNSDFYQKLILTLNLIASGAKEGEAYIDLSSALSKSSHAPTTVQRNFYDSPTAQTFLAPNELAMPLLNVPGVIISNYGIINGRLHVLTQYERPKNLSINRILDMTLQSSPKTWDSKTETYTTNGIYTGTVHHFFTNDTYYAEYIFDLPHNYTSSDLQVRYHYRTYDYIMGMSPDTAMNLAPSEATHALWKLNFNPATALEEHPIPFKVLKGSKIMEEVTASISSIGLMLPQNPDPYVKLFNDTFMQNMSIILKLQDGSVKTIPINSLDGYIKADGTEKTKLLFSEFLDVSSIKEAILTLP